MIVLSILFLYNHITNKKTRFYFLQKWKRNIMENFGAVLKDIRISKNFRLKDLACDKISESTISRFENGITKLSINHFYILYNYTY